MSSTTRKHPNADATSPLVTSRAAVPPHKMPGHWLLAKMGKRVLRPGGRELTRWMLAQLQIDRQDDVVEFAPGLGETAQLVVARQPRSYVAIERDGDALRAVEKRLSGPNQKCLLGTADETGLPDRSASVVFGEAMLSMQPGSTKAKIVAEATRVLRAGGRYAIHELTLTPDSVERSIGDAVIRELSDEIHVGVRPLTVQEWRELLTDAGLTVVSQQLAPMHLLEPMRLVRDEGFVGALRFVWNVARNAEARCRVRRMRGVFRKYRRHLAAVSLVAVKKGSVTP